MIYEQMWDHNSIENIASHLQIILKSSQLIQTIHFRDDNFLVNKSFIFKLFQTFEDRGLHFSWSAQTSINVLKKYTDEELTILKKSGCTNISIGIESGDEFILQKVTKSKTNLNAGIDAIKKLIEAEIAPSVTSIISFPYNNGRDFNKTLKYLMKIKLLYPGLSLYCTMFQPIPKSEIYKELFSEREAPDEVMTLNTWTSKKKIDTLKKFENFYFTFINRNFFKIIPSENGKKLKWINKLFYPFILLRFKLGYTGFLWEYFLVKKRIERIKSQNYFSGENEISRSGIRHLNSNFDFGYKTEKLN